MDLDEMEKSLRLALLGAQRAQHEASGGTASERNEAAESVRRAEEALAWFLHDAGAE
jgi:hypothetical protein